MSDINDLVTETLSRDECLQLLQTGSYVGRVGFVAGGLPHILPVNYLAEAGAVYFTTADGTMLHALAQGAPVVFEVDSTRPLYHSGWSVVVRGSASEVAGAQELERLRRGPLRSWARRSRERWIRIDIIELSGRRIPES